MNSLSDILIDLRDTDLTLQELHTLAGGANDDRALRVNIDAIAKRRRDLERQLDAQLRIGQLDLIRYRVEREDGDVAAAAASAQSLVLFQEVITAVFDAIRDRPKRRYAPTGENAALPALHFAAAPTDSPTMSLSIPNDRLLAIRSELDLTFELVFALFHLRSVVEFRHFAPRTGIAPITKLSAWATNSIEHGLRTTIGWQKTKARATTTVTTLRDATALRRAIEAASDELIEDTDIEGRLVSLDEALGTFRIQSETASIQGFLASDFPRGGGWIVNAGIIAVLSKATRTDYATGAETVHWTLRSLIQHH
ncbi:hypothetical protein [Bauldia litoralis]|uniref:hypothetical protein n=1 Tax=Bauldia litoralis TaxID=665467 RepID=UPI003263E0D8